ncbi:hypothetical protein E2320_001745 [Naja naja]|nr:hypothetical protein E2320_001745 [Naja naja]
MALLAPQTVKAMTWEELQEVLSNHYKPKPSRIAHQHAFGRRNQTQGETINRLSSDRLHCGFRDLDDILLDQLVCGIRDLCLQRHLLAKADLNLNPAIEEAHAMEMSMLSAAEIQGSSSYPSGRTNTAIHYEEAVNAEFYNEEEEINHLKGLQLAPRRNNIADKRFSSPQIVCLSNGGNYARATCCFRNIIFLKCQKKGHLARISSAV